MVEEPDERLDLPVHFPDHPAFGPVSSVGVPIPASPQVPPAGGLASTISHPNDRIGIEGEFISPPPEKQNEPYIMRNSGSEDNLSGAGVAETGILEKFGDEIHQSGVRIRANDKKSLSTDREICSVDVMEAHGHTEYFSAKGRTIARQHDNTTQAFTTGGFCRTTHVK